MGFKKLLGCVLIVSTLTGCAAHNMQIVDRETIEQTLLAFLEDGKTTKKELLSRLEEPSAQFEGGRILTYRLDRKFKVVTPEDESSPSFWYGDPGKRLSLWKRARYSLVLVFDAGGVLQRHSLVRVR